MITYKHTTQDDSVCYHLVWYVCMLSSCVVCLYVVILCGMFVCYHLVWYVCMLSSCVVCLYVIILYGMFHGLQTMYENL
jgi:hypothetical protein